jgi:hypothetical protein
MNPSTPPKGSLEDLFRYHLLESEAAAVPPRPQVWEQVDNSLLLAQNEKYRRRLTAYRWAVAASLLLASMAGGGWWHSQRQAPATATLAQATTQRAANQASLATARRAATPSLPTGTSAAPIASQVASVANVNASFSTVRSSAIDQTTTLSAAAPSDFTAAIRRTRRGTDAGTLAERLTSHPATDAPVGQALTGYAPTAGELTAGTGHRARRSQLASRGFASTTRTTPLPDDVAVLTAPVSAAQSRMQYQPAAGATARSVVAPAAMAAATEAGLTTEATLAARLASLTQPVAGLPANLSEVAVADGPPLELARHWQYGASYSASAYNPNIEWVKVPVVVASSAATSHPATFTRSVASEYRDNLRTGLGQRLSLWATRRLGNGRWGLRTGVELAQNTATSASSVAFVGEPVADLNYLQAGQVPSMQRTSYRYRSVSVPAELRYTNPIKTGFSFYGRIGAVVTALLNVHSEVEGTPEATRTYSPLTGSTPYRRVSAGLRGGAGMQYRPAGHQWALNFGPVVEMGILSLNAATGQDFWSQQRPYSFGLEAGMELGRGFRLQ